MIRRQQGLRLMFALVTTSLHTGEMGKRQALHPDGLLRGWGSDRTNIRGKLGLLSWLVGSFSKRWTPFPLVFKEDTFRGPFFLFLIDTQLVCSAAASGSCGLRGEEEPEAYVGGPDLALVTRVLFGATRFHQNSSPTHSFLPISLVDQLEVFLHIYSLLRGGKASSHLGSFNIFLSKSCGR